MAKNRIHSKGSYRLEEFVAGEAGIYPGMLIVQGSAGTVTKLDTENAVAEMMFAAEDALQGHVVGDAYDDESIVSAILPVKGAEVNALIKSDEDISVGDKLVAAGGGLLQAAGSLESETTAEVVAYAAEDCDLSASGAENTLSRVRIA